MATEEMSIINASYKFWGARKGTDWADRKALEVAASFLGVDGYQNCGLEMEQFNWPLLCEKIAQALRQRD